MSENAYTKPHRLADVLALIQVLAFDVGAHRTEDGMMKELQSPPRSASTWYGLAAEHPEFFRINPTSATGLSLTARHVLVRLGGTLPQLTPEFTSMLLQTAITLHDRQVNKAERFKSFWPPIITGALAIVSGVAVALLTAHITHPVSTHRFVGVQGSTAGVLLDTSRGEYCWAGLGTKPSLTAPLPDCSTLR